MLFQDRHHRYDHFTLRYNDKTMDPKNCIVLMKNKWAVAGKLCDTTHLLFYPLTFTDTLEMTIAKTYRYTIFTQRYTHLWFVAHPLVWALSQFQI